jgi:hypothetical protein
MIFYHATPASKSTVVANGLLPSDSEMAQTAVYLSQSTELALATAEGYHASSTFSLVAVLVSPQDELHPDDFIFEYREELDGVDIDKLFRSKNNGLPASTVTDLEDDDLDSVLASEKLLVNWPIHKSLTALGNVTYHKPISCSAGSPRIIEIAEYSVVDGFWVTEAQTLNMPRKIKRT